jgi:general secretion pathway protein K
VRRHGTRTDERGVALVVVLWGVALIAAAIVAIGMITRSESLIARNALENARARHAAEAGVQLALHRLLSYPRGTHLFDGAAETWQDGTTAVALAIQDEEGKVDLNAAPFALILGALRSAGATPPDALAIACAVVARRGYVDLQCLEGEAPPPAVAPGLLVAVEELRRLAGVDAALYRRLAPLVTVFSGSAAIDPRLAPRDVLRAVPTLSEGYVDSYVGRRAAQRDGGGPDGLGELRDRRFFAVSTGRTFAIAAHAATAGGARHSAEMVVRLTHRGEQPYAVLAWREPPG